MSDYVRHELSPAAAAKLAKAGRAFVGQFAGQGGVCDECERPSAELLEAGLGWFKRREPVRLCRPCYDRLATDLADACPPDEREL
jgi:hypothetical protein